MTYKRTLTPVERYYVSCDNHKPPHKTPCLNQMMLEGIGDFDESKWQKAVEIASQKNPGSRLVLSGKLGFSKWKASNKPARLRIVDGSNWDGMSDANCPFQGAALPPFEGPTTEVVLIKGNPARIAVRTHHGAMDGRGTQTFIDDVFRVLNGEEPLGENSTITDLELAKQINGGEQRFGEFIPDDAIPPTGKPDGNSQGSHWIRRRLPGKHKQVLAKAAIAISELTNRFGESNTRIQLPVDMRPRAEGIRSTGNLTGTIMMNVNPSTTPDEWDNTIRQLIEEQREAELPRFASSIPLNWFGWLPLSLMKYANKKLSVKRLTTGLYRTHAIISNLGRLPISNYSGGGFEAKCGFFIPPEFEATAFFLTMSGSPDGIDFVLRIPNVLATNNRMEKALDYILSKYNIESLVAA
ncbi:peptide synthetase [Pleionea sediminis]|uniref:peptide synthetase n=1 Tax=Pleionea sediminis TaxID=2569479 RepID=UPI0011869006|nr:peptide synthetase [Pleionea sediminis]